MSLKSEDDARLLKLIAAGRTDALEELYDRYNRLVFSVALAVVGDGPTAEEVTLDVFVRVWRGAGTYRPERAKVSTWLAVIARHHAIDILRWRASRPSGGSVDLDEASLRSKGDLPDPQDSLETTVERERVRAALAQLPEEQRQALLLAYFKGYTHREIAELLNRPLGTVKTHIRMGMKRLRELLSDEDRPSGKSEGA